MWIVTTLFLIFMILDMPIAFAIGIASSATSLSSRT